MPKFKYGDKATLNNYEGEIISIFLDINHGYMCRIRFDNQTLIPNEMEVHQDQLKMVNRKVYNSRGHWYNPKTQCPECGDKWHISKMGMHLWYDCLRCKKTKEELLN